MTDCCGRCGSAMPTPVLEDAIVGVIRCPECEDWHRELREDERRAAVDTFATKLLELFKSVTGLDASI